MEKLERPQLLYEVLDGDSINSLLLLKYIFMDFPYFTGFSWRSSGSWYVSKVRRDDSNGLTSIQPHSSLFVSQLPPQIMIERDVSAPHPQVQHLPCKLLLQVYSLVLFEISWYASMFFQWTWSFTSTSTTLRAVARNWKQALKQARRALLPWHLSVPWPLSTQFSIREVWIQIPFSGQNVRLFPQLVVHPLDSAIAVFLTEILQCLNFVLKWN